MCLVTAVVFSYFNRMQIHLRNELNLNFLQDLISKLANVHSPPFFEFVLNHVPIQNKKDF